MNLKHEVQTIKEALDRFWFRLKWDSNLTAHIIVGGFYVLLVVGMIVWKV